MKFLQAPLQVLPILTSPEVTTVWFRFPLKVSYSITEPCTACAGVRLEVSYSMTEPCTACAGVRLLSHALCIQALHSFLLRITHGNTTLQLIRSRLMDTWVVHSFGLLWIKLLWIFWWRAFISLELLDHRVNVCLVEDHSLKCLCHFKGFYMSENMSAHFFSRLKWSECVAGFENHSTRLRIPPELDAHLTHPSFPQYI